MLHAASAMTAVCAEPWVFWWELCEMVRRLTLVGVFVVIEQGSIVQLMIGTAFSAGYMLIQMQVDPYLETSDDYLANGCSFSLLVYFLCCIMYKVGALTQVQSSFEQGGFLCCVPPLCCWRLYCS